MLASCKKDKSPDPEGTVREAGFCSPTAWVVSIDNADAGHFSFLCNGPLAGYNCSNSVIITNLPPSLAQAGKKIRFREWTEQASCLSSSTAPRIIEARGLIER